MELGTHYVFLIFLVNILGRKDKKGVTIVNAFQKNLKESNRKRNKAWTGKVVNFTINLLNIG